MQVLIDFISHKPFHFCVLAFFGLFFMSIVCNFIVNLINAVTK